MDMPEACHALGVVFFVSSHGHARGLVTPWVLFFFVSTCQRPVRHALGFLGLGFRV